MRARAESGADTLLHAAHDPQDRARFSRASILHSVRFPRLMPTIMTLAAAVLLCATPIDLEIETTRAAIPTLATSVEIDLDSYDIPIIRAVTLADAVRAQGWIHARERFLQMDLARREPAGEL